LFPVLQATIRRDKLQRSIDVGKAAVDYPPSRKTVSVSSRMNVK